jgi:hypothetical protein
MTDITGYTAFVAGTEQEHITRDPGRAHGSDLSQLRQKAHGGSATGIRAPLVNMFVAGMPGKYSAAYDKRVGELISEERAHEGVAAEH